MRMRSRLRTGLLCLMGVAMLGLVCAAGLALIGVKVSPVVVVSSGLASIWVPTALCWLAVYRVRLRRTEVLLAAAGVTSWTVGCTYHIGLQTTAGPVPFPSPADAGSVLFYSLMAAALVVTVHRQARGVASSVWWGTVVGSLGAAAVLAVVLGPLLAPARVGHHSLATLTLSAYPLCDLLLVVAVAGVAALRDVRMAGRWGLLVAGLIAFAAADVIYSLKMSSGTYAYGTPSDSGWGIGLALMALWVDGAVRERPASETRSGSGAMSLAVSSGATLAGLWVLLLNNWVPVSPVALTLATVTLLAAAARSELAFRLLARLADQRRLTAATDELTGLPNRRALTAQGQARIAAHPERRQALVVLDLDKFKEVNDSLGHVTGDQVLVLLGVRLREQLRDEDLLARLGSDEFAVLLDDAGRDEAVDVAARLQAAMDEPFALQYIALHSSVSIGIALYPDDGPDLQALLSKADMAMHKAKTSLTKHHVYSRADDAADVARLQTVEELRTALAAGQLVLHYQPKVDLARGDVRSVEALVRWDHPIRGLLYPDAFLALVEEFGLMPALTEVVLELALDQVMVWARQGRPMTVAVNLSASSLVDDNLPEHVADLLADRGVPSSSLQLEITEEFLMSDRDRARSILTRLRGSGIEISVDDYGTGYSSLSYLLDLPIDELKLDRSFVFQLADNARSAALVASTIALAHSLGLRMVAEGVETGIVFTELRRLGCDQAQGYFMSRPLPAGELESWLDNRRELDPSVDLSSGLQAVDGDSDAGACLTVVGRRVSLCSDQAR